MKIELVGNDGVVHGNFTIHPHGTPAAMKEAKVRLPGMGTPTCELYCGKEQAPFEKVCRGGSEPWDVCSECEACKDVAGTGAPANPRASSPSSGVSDKDVAGTGASTSCKSFCGNEKSPFKKVCPWGYEPWDVCSECDGCKNTTVEFK